SDIRQCGEIVECIENLKLGETADISIKDYDNELIYTLSLWEENTAFEEGEINLHFMDDFRYVKVCDCENDVSICKEEHPVYKVENPEIILSLFENDPNASYVSTEDFYSLVEYAGKYMRETPVKNLIDQSGTTLVLPDGVTAYGDPAFVKIDRIHSYPDKEEDYNLSFTAMFKYPDENRYLSNQVYMEVEKNAIGWKTNRLRITM
ncbi:MAG: hypothetical protein IJD80_05720, partial [Oscillospiraceae bacterium]|nr:hypothetical protein [Oscillospiraceae bacterium]